ncbi:EscU/YscU/HrcU family type III secretion system export apparatus switch protein [Salmonella enterica]|nr:EscU/YscU/HrcU family type III secretion system export apparatus switch protein [Salmonella enterica subsp. enterica serovar Sandiego]EEC0251374.1 EscU/YscU/HrcU family type III secretion system export apparatus switch protein [Salmonella enterica subsp. enterica]EEE4266740.1 EscU/YscU/HrcU family type III secretion system export apparatus switch protein [Salmonella enterica subsp. enterica serovar Sandiego]EJW2128686.1 EscU/YscU/HrcU family type III secretion system export apparatus switch p
MSEKTEHPTVTRLRDARKEGQVAKSQEINALVQLAVILLWMLVEGPMLYHAFEDLIISTVEVVNLALPSAINVLVSKLIMLVVRFVFGLSASLAVLLILTGLIQSGFLFAPKAIQPSGKRINPLANAKQMVSLIKLFEFGKMLFKVGILALTFSYLIEHYSTSFINLSRASLMAGILVCSKMVQWMWAILLILTALFAVADYVMQHYQLRKQLMMSKEDIKQEFKNAEGSPEIKKRRRELHREVQSGSLAEKVADASVVVRNPTHIAVCLRYHEGETPLPRVLEYGCNERALQIVALAEARGIPVVENISLARSLLVSTRPGDFIPEDLFVSVAQVLRLLQEEKDEDEDEDEE